MFPVGVLTEYMLGTPIVRNGRVEGFYDGYVAGRKFPIDMAGFAINIKYLLSRPFVEFQPVAGFQETALLTSLGVELSDIEPLAENCTQVREQSLSLLL